MGKGLGLGFGLGLGRGWVTVTVRVAVRGTVRMLAAPALEDQVGLPRTAEARARGHASLGAARGDRSQVQRQGTAEEPGEI